MKISLILAALAAGVAAYPKDWVSDKQCVVPVSDPFKGKIHSVTKVFDAKDGPECAVTFVGDKITVKSNVDPGNKIGYIVQVSEGTVGKPTSGKRTGTQGATCAYGVLADAAIEFPYTAAAAPSGKPITVSATCGSEVSQMYTTLDVARK